MNREQGAPRRSADARQLRLAIEGFDGSGKTSLAKAIVRQLRVQGVDARLIGRRIADADAIVGELTNVVLRIDDGSAEVSPAGNAHLRLARLAERRRIANAAPEPVVIFDRWAMSDLSRLPQDTADRYMAEFMSAHDEAAIDILVFLDGEFDVLWDRILRRGHESMSPSERKGAGFVRPKFERLTQVRDGWPRDVMAVDALTPTSEVAKFVLRRLLPAGASVATESEIMRED